MPGQGSTFGIYPDMNEREHAILQVGIPVIQLVYPKRLKFEQSIYGYFGVRVDLADPDVRNSRPTVTWWHGGNAHITFEIKNKRGLGVAWMPDDPWMHNRVILLDHPADVAMIRQQRFPDGNIKSGAEISFELAVLESVLKNPVPIWHVTKNGNPICWFDDKKKAEDFKEDQGRTEVKLAKDGTFKPLKIKEAEFGIKEDEKMVWKPEVEAMMIREKNRYQYGWTECEEFKNKWRPQIIDTIKENREKFNHENEQMDVREAVSELDQLTDEQLDKLAERIASRKQGKKPGRPKKRVVEEEEVIK